jgi:ABC-2 type transport system ATP-binding protein
MSIIEVRNLQKTFAKKQVLSDITFTVGRGEIFGFLGPNGAGKTTTMYIILGLLAPTAGETLVMGSPLGESAELRRKTGVVLEKHGMYESFSGYQNLDYFAQLYGVQNRKKRIEYMLEQTGLTHARNQKVGTYSTGMKRRLALARALLHEPEVLFLDEPTAGLDPEAQRGFRNSVMQLSREEEMTVFLNSHNLDEVQRMCSGIAILDRGTIKAWDTLEGLKKRFSEPKVEIELGSEEEVSRAERILQQDPSIASLRKQGKRFTCELQDTRFTLKQLVMADIEIEEFTKATKSLEDVYMDIVKHSEGPDD